MPFGFVALFLHFWVVFVLQLIVGACLPSCLPATATTYPLPPTPPAPPFPMYTCACGLGGLPADLPVALWRFCTLPPCPYPPFSTCLSHPTSHCLPSPPFLPATLLLLPVINSPSFLLCCYLCHYLIVYVWILLNSFHLLLYLLYYWPLSIALCCAVLYPSSSISPFCSILRWFDLLLVYWYCYSDSIIVLVFSLQYSHYYLNTVMIWYNGEWGGWWFNANVCAWYSDVIWWW